MKTILVTGATDGIGLAAARALAGQGHRVIAHGRSPVRLERARVEIHEQTGREIETALADFAKFDDVKRLAADVVARFPRLDVLVDNAGVYEKRHTLTVDGFETTFQVNYLAPYMMTNLLLDRLIASAPARVVIVSSTVHQGAELRLDDLQSEAAYDGYDAYSVSKLADLMFAYDLAEALDPQQVAVNAMHPGGVATKLLRAGFGGGGIPPEAGADTIVYLASSPEVEGVTGKYFIRRHPARSSSASMDKDLREALQQKTEALLRPWLER